MKIFESLGWQTPSDDLTRNRHQLSSRMIMSGFTINARRAGRTLAIVTTPANTIGAASHTHKAGEPRSEEHTSELQSRLHLVCRLLLEKKKRPGRLSCRECRQYSLRWCTD